MLSSRRAWPPGRHLTFFDAYVIGKTAEGDPLAHAACKSSAASKSFSRHGAKPANPFCVRTRGDMYQRWPVSGRREQPGDSGVSRFPRVIHRGANRTDFIVNII